MTILREPVNYKLFVLKQIVNEDVVDMRSKKQDAGDKLKAAKGQRERPNLISVSYRSPIFNYIIEFQLGYS